jgi:hypothetical protein
VERKREKGKREERANRVGRWGGRRERGKRS